MTVTTLSTRIQAAVARFSTSEHWIRFLIGIILASFSVAMFYPFLWLLFSSFKTGADIIALPVRLLPRKWTLSAFQMVWTRANLARAYANSLGVSGAIVVTILFTSSLGGFVFARLEFPGRKILFYFILSTTMVPFITLLIPFYLIMMRLRMVNSYIGLWFPSAVSAFGIFLCRQFIYGIPGELYDAAKMDGCGDFGIYYRIILPLLKPVLAALAIFDFLGSFNAYLWPLVSLSKHELYTLPLLLAMISNTFGGTNYQGVMAGSLLACIPPLLVYILFQRHFVRGIALTGIRG